MKVLIVDDEKDILDSTAEWLRASGHEVVTCSSASKALEALRAQRPDIVLHDVRMPGLDLRLQMQSFRRETLGRPIPIILFTATLAATELAAEVGADDGIEKPFDPDELARVLDRWKGGRHP